MYATVAEEADGIWGLSTRIRRDAIVRSASFNNPSREVGKEI
jgi:hypothetical protein